MTKTGLFLGRFQPFHNAHLICIKDALKQVDELIIGIGSSQYENTKENPFSFKERKEMIENVLKAESITNCFIFPIPDIHEHSRWVEHVENLTPEFDVVFTGSPITKKLFGEKGYEIIEVKRVKGISGSDIRKNIAEDKEWQHMVPETVEKFLEKNIKRIKT